MKHLIVIIVVLISVFKGDLVAGQTDCSSIEDCTVCEDPRPVCTTCNDNTYRKNDYVCLSCSLGCTACVDTNDDDVTECTACQSGYFLTEEKTCSLCPANCPKCVGLYDCNACDIGYHYNLRGTDCLDCSSHCLLCSSGSVCTKCEDYYYINGGKSCSKCVTGCLKCPGGTCTECEAGKTYDGSKCVDCIPHCLDCIFEGGCRRCETGYSLSSDYSTCLVCDNCLSCPERGGCTGCDVGYVLDEEDKTCWPCPHVDVPEVCEECGTETRARFFDVETAACLYCPYNCDECSAVSECSVCIDGYFLNAILQCQRCDSSCETCAGNATICTSCMDGYGLLDGTCRSCHEYVSGCTLCDGDVCTQCTEGLYAYSAPMYNYENYRGQCRQCLSSTERAVNSFSYSMCNSCQRYATYLSDEYCRACGEGCVQCRNDGCLVCEDGLLLTESGDCVTTNEDYDSDLLINCLQPLSDYPGNGPDQCGQCLPHFYFNGTHCQTDDEADMPNCKVFVMDDFDGDTCDRCDDRKYFDATEHDCISPAFAGSCVVYEFDGSNRGAPSRCLQCDSTHYPIEGVCVIMSTSDRVPNCIIHSWLGFCDTCEAGYYQDINTGKCIECTGIDANLNQHVCEQCSGSEDHIYQFWLSECWDCPLNCETCSRASSCDQCKDGLYWNSTACIAQDCTDIKTELECESCQTDKRGKYWTTATKCQDCPLHCLACTLGNSCDVCDYRYIWNSDKNRCISCDYDAEQSCSNCITENRGRYLSTYPEQCLLCPELCATCTDHDTCVACDVTSYMSDGACYNCTNSALSDIHCLECNENKAFYPARLWSEETNFCEECPEYCLSCQTPRVCDDDGCIAGRFWHSNGAVCRNCVANCKHCTNDTSCNECESGRYYNANNNACFECAANCTACVPTSEGCTACDPGLFLSGQRCLACGIYINNCLECDDEEVCTKCDNRFYLTNGQCRVCMENCDVCTTSNDCQQCTPWTCYDPEDNVCRLRGTLTCKNCKLVTGALTCLSCPSERYYYGICQACRLDQCTKCSTDIDICERCAPNYFLLDGHCSLCPENCERCVNSTTCWSCKSATYWNETTVKCEPCPTSCIACDNATSCTTCQSTNMYFHDGDMQCKSCIDGCTTCSSIEDCNSCNTGYYREGNTICGKCEEGCSSCLNRGDEETADAQICFSCFAGRFKKSDRNCHLCSDTFANCNECRDYNGNDQIDTGECSSCTDGYMLNDDKDKCLLCGRFVTGCKACEDPTTICTECETGKAPTSDNTACGFQCYQCYGTGCERTPVSGKTSTIGCTDSCWSAKKIDNGTEEYYRGCLTQLCSFNYIEKEICEVKNNVTDCRLCCTGAECNHHILDGEEIPVTRPTPEEQDDPDNGQAAISPINMWIKLVCIISISLFMLI